MSSRLNRIREALEEESLDALLISSPVDDVLGLNSQNRRYVSGFTGSTGHALITRDGAFLAVDFRYYEQGEQESVPLGFELYRHKEAFRDWFPKFLKHAGMASKRIGVSAADVSLSAYDAMQRAVLDLPWALRPKLGPASPMVEKLRRQKDADEVRALQEAIDVADAAFQEVAAGLAAGQTEREVAEAVEHSVRAHGAQGVSFDTIVAAGPWAAMPHANPRPERIREMEPIVIDMGARVGGYCSDLTRTLVLGTPDAKFREIYTIVHEAQRNAIEKVETGMTGVQAHELAFSVIERHGHGEHFGHGLGHGVGLEVHEAPYLGKTSTDTLEEGNIFTIEPGIYLPGWGGVRIEDVVILENGRARVLSHAPKLIPGEDFA
jgi:Xaa-Pro aminopeptidase